MRLHSTGLENKSQGLCESKRVQATALVRVEFVGSFTVRVGSGNTQSARRSRMTNERSFDQGLRDFELSRRLLLGLGGALGLSAAPAAQAHGDDQGGGNHGGGPNRLLIRGGT